MDEDETKRLRAFCFADLPHPYENFTVLSYDFGRPPMHTNTGAHYDFCVVQPKQASSYITVRYRDFELKIVIKLEYDRHYRRDGRLAYERNARVFVSVSKSGELHYDARTLCNAICQHYCNQSQLSVYLSRNFDIRQMIHKKLLYCSSRIVCTTRAKAPSSLSRS